MSFVSSNYLSWFRGFVWTASVSVLVRAPKGGGFDQG